MRLEVLCDRPGLGRTPGVGGHQANWTRAAIKGPRGRGEGAHAKSSVSGDITGVSVRESLEGVTVFSYSGFRGSSVAYLHSPWFFPVEGFHVKIKCCLLFPHHITLDILLCEFGF